MPAASRLGPVVLGAGLIFALAGFVAFAAVLDVFAPQSHGRGLWIKAAFLGVAALPAVALALGGRRRWMFGLLGVAAAAVAALVSTPWHPRKAFVHDLESVRPGMTVEQVEQRMGRYMKGVGTKWGEQAVPAYPEGEARKHATFTMYYRWNATDGAYDSDWGRVDFEAGRVKDVEFLPD